METSKISMRGFVSTLSSYTGLGKSRLSEWLTRDRCCNHDLAQKIYTDLENAQRKVMEKWEKDKRFITMVEKAKARKTRSDKK